MKTDNFSPPFFRMNSHLGGSIETAMVEKIFDHVPDIVFLLKTLMAVILLSTNHSLNVVGSRKSDNCWGGLSPRSFPRNLPKSILIRTIKFCKKAKRF